MEKIRFSCMRKINSLIAFCLTLLGATSCGEGMVCMYGVPMATIEVDGNITNTGQEPLDSIEVTLRTTEDYIEGVTLTNNMGHYAITQSLFPVDSIWVIAKDIKQSRLTPYKSDSVRVKFNPTNGDSSWDKGSETITVNFVLKPKSEE